MRILKKWVLAFTAFTMIISLFTVTSSVQAASVNADTYIKQLIAYYRDYQENAATDIQRVLQELKAVDESKYEAWNQIMNYWSYANTDMVVNDGVAADGLPNDNSVCIVILGFALNSDGTMKSELIGRLQAGLDTANKYPNAYVVVTGGGTASGNPNVTEGGLMGEWLLDQGLSADRLIIENKAPDTVGNAKNTYDILSSNYPDVKSLIMVTSDYHVPRGSILFYSKCLLAAYESGGKPLEMISNAGYNTGSKGYETISLQASGVATVAGVSLSGVSVTLSQLTGLRFAQEGEYQAGEDLKLTVTAEYDNGFSRDVSDLVTVSNFDPSLGANQTITISYTENGITINGLFDLSKTAGSIADNTYLRNLIAKVEVMNLSSYTKASIARLQAALASAKTVVESGTTDNKVVKEAYQNLSNAVNKLAKRVNIAKNMSVEANCNQGDAVKITDGTVSTSNYWASVNNGTNVAASDAEVIIDLGGVYHVDSVQVYPYWGGNRIYKYELFGSKDKINWQKIGENISNDYATSSGFTHDMDEQIAYVKLVGIETKVEGRDDINNLHIIEIQVYGDDAYNLAYLKPVTSSGTDTSAGSSASSSDATVVDGDRSTYWDGGVYADSPWITVDLEAMCQIDEVNIVTYWSRPDNRYYYYDIYTSLDGKNYTLAYSKKDNTDKATIYGDTFDFTATPLYARYVKIIGTYDSVNPSFHLNEIRVLGKAIGDDLIEEMEALKAMVEQAQAVDLTNRTEASITRLQGLIAQAEKLIETPLGSMTLDEITTMKNELNQGISSLEYVDADYTKVDEAIRKAETLNPNDYMDFSAVEETIDAVIRDKKINEQDAVDAMAKAIENAIAKLQKKAQPSDLAALQEAIAKAKALKEQDYAPSTWKVLTAVIERGEATAEKDIAALSEVNECIADIENAIKGLKPREDYRTVTDENISVTGKMEEDVKLLVINTAKKATGLFQELCEKTMNYDEKYFVDKELLNVYDIKLIKNNVQYKAEGTMLVRIKLQKEWIGRDLSVIYIKEDGSFETVRSSIVDGTLSFSVEHFSYYGIVGSKKSVIETPVVKPNQPVQKPGESGTTGADTGVEDYGLLNSMLMLMSGTLLAVYRKKHRVKAWK